MCGDVTAARAVVQRCTLLAGGNARDRLMAAALLEAARGTLKCQGGHQMCGRFMAVGRSGRMSMAVQECKSLRPPLAVLIANFVFFVW